MSGLEAFVLGIVQGLTEFLPVSSKGHLVMAETLLGVRLDSLTFELLVHLATLGAVLLVLGPRIWRILQERDLTYLAKIGLACVPVGAAGFLLKERIERIFHDPVLTGVGLLFTGCVLFGARFLRRGTLTEPTFVAALVVGLAQVPALLPGVSRSGMTIVAALAMGVVGTAAAEFSFLVSLPVISAAVALQAGAVAREGTGLGSTALAVGFVSAFVFGVLAIRVVYRLLAHHRFGDFAFYCWPAGLLFILYVLLARP